ncbi:hypothetical protein BDW22DRAFT_1407534 [Trametopsis cervina]|nr:hypothetical protein BDW22DRAFT_1407534 [Trametopsis cervina]
MSKVVFVGNVPYNMGEEQLIDAFKSVGQVIGFRLVYDRDTGKPKGYGFCEFADHDTALSAVRNLNGQEVGGRPLRIDLADSDPFLEGKTTVRGELLDAQETRAQWRERERERERETRGVRDPKSFLADLPPGVPVPPGKTAGDIITEVLATTAPSQIYEVLAQMKAFVITHPEQARALLIAHPQLGYAMFQALLLNKIVDPAILERMLAATTGAAAPAGPMHPPPPLGPTPSFHQPPPVVQHPQPGFNPPPPGMPMGPPHSVAPHHPTPPPPGAPGSMYPPQPHMPYYRGPLAPAPAPIPAPPQAPVAAAPPAAPPQQFDPASRDMLMQVLNLTSEQVTSLPAAEREQINQLRKQFGMPLLP